MNARILFTANSRSIRLISTSSAKRAMKPGTPIAGLDFLKNEEPAVSKERSEYPEWVNNLDKAATSLAKLKKVDIWEASDEDQKRYLKLTRRNQIKETNVDAGLK
jgi:hypothetical protein